MVDKIVTARRAHLKEGVERPLSEDIARLDRAVALFLVRPRT